MYYVGLDVHYRTSTYCILNNDGREVKCETIRGHWTKLLEKLAVIKGKLTVCFEATCGYGYLYRELSRMASRCPPIIPIYVLSKLPWTAVMDQDVIGIFYKIVITNVNL